MLKRSLRESFRDAGAGLWWCLATQRNMRIHAAAAGAAFFLAWALRLSREEVALVVFAVGLVFAAEMFNTALEQALDACVGSPHPRARAAKHAAAGAVLVAALSAAAVGCLVFLPRLVRIFCR